MSNPIEQNVLNLGQCTKRAKERFVDTNSFVR